MLSGPWSQCAVKETTLIVGTFIKKKKLLTLLSDAKRVDLIQYLLMLSGYNVMSVTLFERYFRKLLQNLI